MAPINAHGQPIGEPVAPFGRLPLPEPEGVTGRTLVVERLDATRHGDGLTRAFAGCGDALWTYLSFGPFDRPDDLLPVIDDLAHRDGWVPVAVVVDGEPMGFASYLRIDRDHGVIEIGSIAFSPSLQRTTAATEALVLLMAHAFDLGYRRCEWKCDDLNAPSRAAALRLGFTYEGTFRNAMVTKGRNRDTAWFSVTAGEWPERAAVLDEWLRADNFDQAGRQRTSLAEIRSGRADERDTA